MSKISKLKIKNFIGIEEMAIDFKDINKISGGNGRGKTTILDSIQKAIYNSMNPRPEVVRNGEESAQLFVELDNGITIERVIKSDGADKVKVLDNGQPVARPESFLRKLLGNHIFSFNPVAFLQKSDKEQAEILLSLLPITVTYEDVRSWLVDDELYPEGYAVPINFNQHGLQVCKELASKNSGYLYDKRAVVNKEVALYQDEIVSIENTLPDNYKLEDWENASLKAIQEKINEANKVNSFIQEANNLIENNDLKLENIKNNYTLKKTQLVKLNEEDCQAIENQFQNTIKNIDNEILSLIKKIEDLELSKKQIENDTQTKMMNVIKLSEKDLSILIEQEKREIEEITSRVEKAKKYLEENKLIDIEPLNAEFDEVEKMRGYIPLAEKLAGLKDTWERKRKEAQVLDKFVEIARSKPKELLAKVKLPVDGLGISEDGVITINSLPIRNLSTSEQLKVALDIARVTCNELRVICVDRLESLDEDVKEELFKQIENDGYQYILTDVTKGDMKVEVE
jgi:DNA repair exonuclease SbcCD ATPase subunit